MKNKGSAYLMCKVSSDWGCHHASGTCITSTRYIQVRRSPNFFSGMEARRKWKLLEKMWLLFRLGGAKWQHSPTFWMLVTWSSDSSVLDTENGDVYIRRTARNYLIPPLAWHETHGNSSTHKWDMQWWCYGCEKCAFECTTVQSRPNVVWKQTEGTRRHSKRVVYWSNRCQQGRLIWEKVSVKVRSVIRYKRVSVVHRWKSVVSWWM
jgi:hypothetical protein